MFYFYSGNTPTCVGKTAFSHCLAPACRKHPHVCGEDSRMATSLVLTMETPPRVWGRPSQMKLTGERMGNTPTCVGKTWGYSTGATILWKHPHVCGEDEQISHKVDDLQETPPRVWGRQPMGIDLRKALRNTPTCVGKTAGCPFGLVLLQKHPHVCGEDLDYLESNDLIRETPPRVWGRLFVGQPFASNNGNTPTCVGKTGARRRLACRCRKHPHVCGEDRMDPGTAKNQRETPPRVWGRPPPRYFST